MVPITRVGKLKHTVCRSLNRRSTTAQGTQKMGSYSHLPADLEISERSRKFYDGTYKWDSEGFTDSDGEYHRFDCSNPATQAPTPLPPMLLGDFEGENTGGGFAALEVTTKHTLPVNIAIASGGFGEPGPKSNEYHLTDENLLKSRYEEKDQSPIGNAFLSDHGNHIGSSGLHDTSLSRNGRAVERKAKQPRTSGLTRDILNKQEGEKRAKEPDSKISSYPSDLSDFPSDLSDWDIGDKNWKPKASLSSTDTEGEDDSTGDATWTPPKTTKRGGNKKAKKPATTQPKDPKKPTRKVAARAKTQRAAKRANGGK